MKTADKKIDTIMKRLLSDTRAQWGEGWHRLSDDMKEAELDRSLVKLIAQQDDSVQASTIRTLVVEGNRWIIDWLYPDELEARS